MDSGSQTTRTTSIMVVLLSAGLAIAGNLTGNLVAETVPTGWVKYAPEALAGITGAGIIVALVLVRLRGGGPREQRSVFRRRLTIVILVAGEMLAAIDGVLTNMAAASVPTRFKSIAPMLLLGILLLTIAMVVGLYLWQSSPHVETTTRTHFLEKLQESYIARRKAAISDAILLVLHVQRKPEAVGKAGIEAGTADRPNGQRDAHLLPEEATIEQAYNDAEGRLLILGVPGAGKSMLLLELALLLLGRARRDADEPIPVIFNLSTWAINSKSLDEWLVEDLINTFGVPFNEAQKWLAMHAVLPLLDGFDEVDGSKLAACAQSINRFADSQLHIPIVVCSRIDEYGAQPITLALHDAVVVQPLTDKQIMAYLGSGGERLATLGAVVETDDELRDVLRTPLFLRLVTLTYGEEVAGEVAPTDLPPLHDHMAWRRRLFQDYVEKTLQHPRDTVHHRHYTHQEVTDALVWLARCMYERRSNVFYLRNLTPAGMLDIAEYADYQRVVRRLLFPGGALVGGLVGGYVGSLFGSLGLAGVGAIAGALIVGWAVGTDDDMFKPNNTIAWSFRGAITGGAVGVIVGLLVGLLSGLFHGLYQGVNDGLSVGLYTGILAGIVYGGYGALVGGQVRLEKNRRAPWSWRRALGYGLFAGLLVGIPVGGFGVFFLGRYFGLGLGVGSIVIFGVLGSLTSGEEYRAQSLDFSGLPSQLSRPYIQNGLILGILGRFTEGVGNGIGLGCLIGPLTALLVGLSAALTLGPVQAIWRGLANGFALTVLWGAGGAVVFGVALGVEGLLKQIAFWRKMRQVGVNSDVVDILSYAADHVLLNRVNGGYGFLHILLRDYFVNLNLRDADFTTGLE